MRNQGFFKIFFIVLICAIANINTIFAKNTDSTTRSIGAFNSNAPTFSITEITTPDFETNVGNSDYQTVNLSGLNLSGDIMLTISGPNANEFALSRQTIHQTESVAPNTTVTLSYSPSTTGNHIATLTCSSPEATDITIPLTGVSGLECPVALDATEISESGFKANWSSVPGATDYLVNVYFKPDNPLIQTQQGFDSGTTAPTGWTFTGISGVYTNYGIYGTTTPSLRMDATGDAVTSPILPSAAKQMKFWAKGLSATGSSLLVEGHNGNAWVEIDNIVTPSSSGKTYTYDSTTTPPLPCSITQFRYTYTKVANNIALDDVTFTYAGPATSPVAGSPFTVTGSTSREFSGLNTATKYYYCITAKNSTMTTAASNEIRVSALATNITNQYKTLDLIVSNGTIKLTTDTAENIEIYDSTGQKILQQRAQKGLNSIYLSTRGLLIVKAGERTAKIIL